ncbi:efflux RND transporter periplasmic adaptor subunit [Thermosediminibacter oceani]|uniref:Efflux transporter, RND family, MFP subunit n=1 Tax=Thermosediminibacter oceani (strain ATCC BAA-1034 / DSM 16646 / JW/IW-1228P) TaxID=555079 RepID=D9RZ42_THEOJ|nr:efflux RND transporter periplasmic adaptor subunit [Thermosediminibacter oceani]ADL08596.1 efflux transporter, RND family, MFP subunit [Thermosediminibacter oceani DSM 16646]
MRTVKRKILIVSIILIALVGTFFYENNRGIDAEVLKVQPVTVTRTFKEEGQVIPAVEYSVHSLQAGEIVKLNVEEGQQVKAGDILALLNSKELEFQLKQLQAELKSLRGEEAKAFQKPLDSEIKSQELLVEQARHDLTILENDFKRMEKLYSEGAVTLKEYENARNMMETAKINLQRQQEALKLLYESRNPTGESRQYYSGRAEALQSQIDLLKYRIERCRITSPVDGIVADLTVKQGDVVNPGSRLMKIFQKGEYLVEVFVPADSAPDIADGMKVKLIQERKSENLIFDGVVEKVAPTAVEKISSLGLEEQRVKVTVKPLAPQNLQLIPGTVLDVEFTTDKREGVLAVPKTALFPYENGDAVWVVEGKRAKVRPVKTGFESESLAVIEEGLKKGDLVILNPQLAGLKEGRKIRVK